MRSRDTPERTGTDARPIAFLLSRSSNRPNARVAMTPADERRARQVLDAFRRRDLLSPELASRVDRLQATVGPTAALELLLDERRD
jgi:hypothetical protein